MTSPKFIRGVLLLPAAAALLSGCSAVLMSPAGDLAVRQRDIIIISTILMLLIIVPVIVLTLLFAWRYRESNKNAVYTPEWDHSTLLELLIWSAPLIIIIALGALTWVSTHKLDPYRPLERLDARREIPPDTRALTVQVVAMDWKWLFFYPDQGIATVNELTAPVDRPIRFEITATTMMNSFFVPALAGQVYAMPGMETKLHAVVNKPGVYDGFSANYSGAGFSGMRFKFHGVSPEEFDAWVAKVKAQGDTLSRDKYEALAKPSEWVPVHYYADVAPNLYDAILNRCVQPGQTCLKDLMDQPNHSHASRSRAGKTDALLADAMCTPRNTAQFALDPRGAPGEALTQ
ncbi:ubiquinol oxidase subunit II [Pandoraea nosoerga]|uniref:Ubiquinol oxidase subunit 2 n=1 Tax=Pandoraea nosoerga TaxID=2508296 RepID=A0A5E4XPS6_9BURK|nr:MULTISPECIES: ubiquinol oxidase subunit II [Pandoraea]MBN4667338.1 ubiquinol oxidase subunit II [Pandoraea nosoerga]MBN4677347.1 ubiquinol oxidase subunit II [Pandoraea nosoerga]MBN4682468.1 ubiquinol oxidase subunit II [Pandoraea nosoerga]MBN4746735.1 ubiquinol oxidase subunit II [Pandoraea nosoerga]VVE38511.1 ubiquinol oxidase subunit II [Pandoraea nosoerga]